MGATHQKSYDIYIIERAQAVLYTLTHIHTPTQTLFQTWFCGPNGSWCITEEASAPEGMTHTYTFTYTCTYTQTHCALTFTKKGTRTRSLSLRETHTHPEFRQTEGCFLWLQNIRSWPRPKSHSYYQCESLATFEFFFYFYFVTGRLHFWSGLF